MCAERKLTGEEALFIEEHEKILSGVLEDIKRAGQKKKLNLHKVMERLSALRDEAGRAKEADLPAIFDQMNSSRALIDSHTELGLPDFGSPYFAHMRLVEGKKTRDILLGYVTFLDGDIPIIDWRHAPVSRIFFNYRQGDEYEEKLPGRIARGTLVERNILTIRNSELVHISTHQGSFRKNDEGIWDHDTSIMVPTLKGGQGTANRGKFIGTGKSGLMSPDVAALLDRDQYDLLTSDHDVPLLILGGAGCGKTTVALHRIASLVYTHPGIYSQESIIVIVPEEGLVRLSRKLLDSLGLKRVTVLTFDNWVERQAHSLIRGLPRKVCDSTPPMVTKYKRHPAIKTAFELLARNQAESVSKSLKSKFSDVDDIAAVLTGNHETPILERVRQAQKSHLAKIRGRGGEGETGVEKRIRGFYRDMENHVLDLVSDRIDLFSNKKLIETVVSSAGDVFSNKMINILLSHSADQLKDSRKTLYSGIDDHKLEMADGRSLKDDESQDELADTIDVEDFAVLLELQDFKMGPVHSRLAKQNLYSHMVIDEAQDLAPIELSVLGKTLKENASVTLAGDAAQQIDPSTTFKSWESLLTYLKIDGVQTNHLTTIYRSTRQVAYFAHAILGDMAPKELPRVIKEGEPVTCSFFPTDGHAAIFLSEALANLVSDEPLASIAVICRDLKFAEILYKRLESVPKIRLTSDGEFSFKPGIDLTDVSQVRGLEFDYVIIPDANASRYQDTPSDRRTLHVAVTRAIHQLWVISVGRKSVILPEDGFMERLLGV
ncbi:MAG: AAA family ATPase [Oligoflexales bacterium]|nr:AAA family ATPase [Oligoflexales bacterium]